MYEITEVVLSVVEKMKSYFVSSSTSFLHGTTYQKGRGVNLGQVQIFHMLLVAVGVFSRLLVKCRLTVQFVSEGSTGCAALF